MRSIGRFLCALSPATEPSRHARPLALRPRLTTGLPLCGKTFHRTVCRCVEIAWTDVRVGRRLLWPGRVMPSRSSARTLALRALREATPRPGTAKIACPTCSPSRPHEGGTASALAICTLGGRDRNSDAVRQAPVPLVRGSLVGRPAPDSTIAAPGRRPRARALGRLAGDAVEAAAVNHPIQPPTPSATAPRDSDRRQVCGMPRRAQRSATSIDTRRAPARRGAIGHHRPRLDAKRGVDRSRQARRCCQEHIP
jgi:hypothetical protein